MLFLPALAPPALTTPPAPLPHRNYITVSPSTTSLKMPPDLNSLPPSRSPSISNSNNTMSSHQSPSPTTPAHHAPHSIQVAAMLNANEERRSSSSSQRNSNSTSAGRRRSSVRMQLNLMDPNLPQPSEIQMSPTLHSHRPSWPASPQHQRAPSLGEIHQELESEQEAQVNRLLHMIRRQQAEIATLRSAEPSAIDDSTPSSEQSLSLPHSATASQSNVSQIAPPRPRSPLPGQGSLSRNSSHRRSRNSSWTGSPALRPTSHHSESGDWQLGATGNRDESAFYQAETQMLTRENQMLKMRIRELERQLHHLNPTSPITQAPATTSNLSSPPLRPEDEPSTLHLDSRTSPVTLGEAGALSSAATPAS